MKPLMTSVRLLSAASLSLAYPLRAAPESESRTVPLVRIGFPLGTHTSPLRPFPSGVHASDPRGEWIGSVYSNSFFGPFRLALLNWAPITPPNRIAQIIDGTTVPLDARIKMPGDVDQALLVAARLTTPISVSLQVTTMSTVGRQDTPELATARMTTMIMRRSFPQTNLNSTETVTIGAQRLRVHRLSAIGLGSTARVSAYIVERVGHVLTFTVVTGSDAYWNDHDTILRGILLLPPGSSPRTVPGTSRQSVDKTTRVSQGSGQAPVEPTAQVAPGRSGPPSGRMSLATWNAYVQALITRCSFLVRSDTSEKRQSPLGPIEEAEARTLRQFVESCHVGASDLVVERLSEAGASVEAVFMPFLISPFPESKRKAISAILGSRLALRFPVLAQAAWRAVETEADAAAHRAMVESVNPDFFGAASLASFQRVCDQSLARSASAVQAFRNGRNGAGRILIDPAALVTIRCAHLLVMSPDSVAGQESIMRWYQAMFRSGFNGDVRSRFVNREDLTVRFIRRFPTGARAILNHIVDSFDRSMSLSVARAIAVAYPDYLGEIINATDASRVSMLPLFGAAAESRVVQLIYACVESGAQRNLARGVLPYCGALFRSVGTHSQPTDTLVAALIHAKNGGFRLADDALEALRRRTP
jgi:hypothetical protein